MPLQIPHPSTTLHLYRHLLRESTYLPVLCRPWITARIKQRFRDRREKQPVTPYVKQAHASLQFMRSANAGHVRRLERLCLMATGRVGKRRRILATSQLGNSLPTDTAELEQSRLAAVRETSSSNHTPGARYARDDDDAAIAAAAAAPSSHKPDWLENWSLDMITAIAKSQHAQQTSNWPQTMRRGLDTKHILSGKNCFDRPYGPKLLRNKLKKHWAGVLHQLLPPLPQGEWDHLASLVKGDANVPELVIPTRRPVAQSLQDSNPDLASSEWDWSQHVLKPARVIERGSSRQRKSLTGKEDQDPRGHGTPIGTRVIGPRKLQRIYGRIWTMSPIIKKPPGKRNWSVSWGQNERMISAPATKDLPFFEGVTDDGKVLPKESTSHKG
ncbi:hypothetical protein GGS24DRAFT_453313 [Hypoxylon argillaceum]|nr:hypothetical protein GGS24DRAFT_453313 [Hypoxylon argillaceum]KAI1151450.1 hypothetical protein F4825DRAFT_356909 [Nemania diffusa]